MLLEGLLKTFLNNRLEPIGTSKNGCLVVLLLFSKKWFIEMKSSGIYGSFGDGFKSDEKFVV